VLYLNRHLDNNRLTSWKWVFNDIDLGRWAFVFVLSLVFAWLLSLANFYEKRKALVLFVVSFFTGACFWSAPEVIVDSSRYFTQAKELSVYGVGYFAEQWGKKVFAWTDLPLMPFLYGLVFKFLGEKRIFIQVLNTLFYSSTVVLTYQLGKTLWHEETGFWAGLLLLGFPYLYTQVPLLLVDVPTMFFFMLGVVTCINALKKGGIGRIFLASFALFLAFCVKYSTWIMLTLIPVIYVFFVFTNPVQTLKREILLAMLTLVLVGAFFFIYQDILGPQLEFLVEYQKPGLQRWSERHVSTFLFQTHPFITAAALLGVGAAVRKVDYRFIITSFLVLLFLVMQVKRIRYTLPVFPMLALMAAYGMEEIQSKKLIKHLVFSVAVTSFMIAFMGFLPFLKSLGVQNLQAAGNYLNSIQGENVEIINQAGENPVLNPAIAVPVLDIYTDKNLFYKYEPVSYEVLERYKNSPLRFTWEFSLPEYYNLKKDTKTIDGLAIISEVPEPTIPIDIKNKILRYTDQKKFHQSSQIFKHQTFVTVYHK
jgi:hypothetical protein